jgi:tetratricopeptide (TPR) repeat protein
MGAELRSRLGAWRWAAGAFALAVLALLAPWPRIAVPAEEAGKADAVEPGTSLIGNFLAGRHAYAQRDIAAAARFYAAALKLAPEDPDLLRRAFALSVQDGRVKEALPIAQRLVAFDAKEALAAVLLVVDDVKGRRFAAAGKKLGAWTDGGLNSLLGPLLAAWALVGEGKAEEALAALKALEAQDKAPELYNLHVALVHEFAGRAADAESHYLKVTGSDAWLSLRVTLLLGGLYERTGRADKAKETYRKYVAEHPGTQLLDDDVVRAQAGGAPEPRIRTAQVGAAEALLSVAVSRRRPNAPDIALMLGRMALYLRPDFPVAQFLVGEILEAQERLESANAVYGAIDRGSSFAWMARQRLAANLNKMDRPDEAAQQLRAMAKERADKHGPLVSLGDILRGRQRFDEAVEAYDQAFQRVPVVERQHWSLLYARGIALERSKKWERAEADFLKALEFEPNQPHVLNYLGYSWVEKGMHLDRAKAMIEKAVELRPNDGYIVDSLGWVYYQLGEYEKAVRELERAVELRPEDPVINDHLGDAYWKVGRQLEARFQWQRSLTLKPEPDLVAAIAKKLEKGPVEQAKTGGNG